MSILKKGRPRKKDHIEKLRKELLEGSPVFKFTMNMPRVLHEEFKKKALENRTNMTDALLAYIRKYISI